MSYVTLARNRCRDVPPQSRTSEAAIRGAARAISKHGSGSCWGGELLHEMKKNKGARGGGQKDAHQSAVMHLTDAERFLTKVIL